MPDKAVLLGVNAYKNYNSLRGCVNDVQNVRTLLTEGFGFLTANVKVLLDDKVVKAEVNTLKRWLLADARPGDRLVLHFSGHGSQVPADREDDGVAETICLHDMDFNDPDTFLTSAEMREWTRGLPDGCRLTVIFDSCHSGHGTRMAFGAAGAARPVPTRVDVATGILRAQAGGRDGGGFRDAVARAADPDHDDAVRVRYIAPPPHVQAQIDRRRGRGAGMRELITVAINHVLLAACRKDQTAADATIQGTASGAFTFHLCKVLRDGGAALDKRVLIRRVEEALAADHFDQSPQLETGNPDGPLFSGTKNPLPAPGSIEHSATAAGNAGWNAAEWQGVLHAVAGLAPAAQVLALERLPAAAARPPAARSRDVTTGTRVLVYVHGICHHPAGFSDGWWGVLHHFTTAFGAGTLGDTRREVVWSDLVNERGLALRTTRDAASPAATEHERARREIIEALQDRLERAAIESQPRPAAGDAPRALQLQRDLPSIPGLNCIDDFTTYLTNDATRAAIIGRFTAVVRPLLQAAAAVDVISHSWGTVVAYEGLRQLEDEGRTTPAVNNFFTVGAALSIGPVKSRLRPANRDGHRPAPVKHWVNVNARGDLVGGPLKDRPYAVDDDFPAVTPFGCTSFLTVVSPKCAHGSYFVDGNVEVNRDIFAAEINDA